MRRKLLVILIVFLPLLSFGQFTAYSTNNGNWHANAGWNNGRPDTNSLASINNSTTCYVRSNAICSRLTLQPNAKIIVVAGFQLEIFGPLVFDAGTNLTNNGTLIINGDIMIKPGFISRIEVEGSLEFSSAKFIISDP